MDTFSRERKKHTSTAGTYGFIELGSMDQCSHPLQMPGCSKMQGIHFFFLNKLPFEHRVFAFHY